MEQHVRHGDFYLNVGMSDGGVVGAFSNALGAFWPGVQVLFGDINAGISSHRAFSSLAQRYGFLPEAFNVATMEAARGNRGYPLRPELAESSYLLYKATRDPQYLETGAAMVRALQTRARTRCGFAALGDVTNSDKEDKMDSYFLSETMKYLFLLFSENDADLLDVDQ